MNKITINHGSFRLDDIELDHGTLTIGRSADNDVQLDDSAVSGHHAKIVTFFNVSYIEDLDSTNGTIVNGRKVKKYTLHTGDIVLLGKHQVLFTGSKVQQDIDSSDSTVVMTKTDLNNALATAADANSRKTNTPARPAPVEQNNGAQPASEIPRRPTQQTTRDVSRPQQQQAAKPQPRPLQSAQGSQSTPSNSRPAAARPVPPVVAPFAAKTNAPKNDIPFSAIEDDDEPLDELFKDFVAPVDPSVDHSINDEEMDSARTQIKRAVNKPQAVPMRRNNSVANGASATVARANTQTENQDYIDPSVAAARKPVMNNPSSPPVKRRVVVEDPSAADDYTGGMYHTPLDINETDRSAEYLNRAFGPQGGRQEIPAVGDKTLLRQIITGDRDFSPSRNKFEIIQIVLGFIIFTIIALIAFSNF